MTLLHKMARRSRGSDKHEIVRIGIQNVSPTRQVETEQQVIVDHFRWIHSVVAAVDKNLVGRESVPDEIFAPSEIAEQVAMQLVRAYEADRAHGIGFVERKPARKQAAL